MIDYVQASVHQHLANNGETTMTEQAIINIIANYPEIGELYNPAELAAVGEFWVDDYMGKNVEVVGEANPPVTTEGTQTEPMAAIVGET